jgi:hypothetical protein
MESWPATLCDVSATGVGLRSPLAVPLGTFLLLELPESEATESRTLRAHVVGTREQEEGYYLLGCRLTEQLHPSQLEAFA